MTIEQLLAAVGIYAGTFVVGAISSILPIVCIEVFVVAVAVTTPAVAAVPLVILATCGQVLGKLPVFFAMRRLASLPGRHRRHLDRAQRWLARPGTHPTLVLAASAVFGLPPFSLVATAAGALGISAQTFCLVIAAGRAARFSILIAVASQAG
ncbi:MAG: hypothetical protein SFX73_01840 [Kofleriaceae bacterium]|nr:hypothetical protein [Kofleriaceae bacterium]